MNTATATATDFNYTPFAPRPLTNPNRATWYDGETVSDYLGTPITANGLVVSCFREVDDSKVGDLVYRAGMNAQPIVGCGYNWYFFSEPWNGNLREQAEGLVQEFSAARIQATVAIYSPKVN